MRLVLIHQGLISNLKNGFKAVHPEGSLCAWWPLQGWDGEEQPPAWPLQWWHLEGSVRWEDTLPSVGRCLLPA